MAPPVPLQSAQVRGSAGAPLAQFGQQNEVLSPLAS